MLLEGIFLPLTTPFHTDGRLYLAKLRSNVEHYSRTPAAGLLVLSEVGEASSLTDEETRQMLSAAIAAAAPEKVMIAGIVRQSVFAARELASFAAQAGYDAIAVSAPSFAADESMQLETATYFKTVADASSVPVIVSGSLSLDLVTDLAQHPQIVGLIDPQATSATISQLKSRTSGISREATVTTVFAAATRRMLAASSVSGSALGGVAVLSPSTLKTRTKKVGFQILAASVTGMLDAWQAGASGAVPRLGACVPQACCEVWQAFRDGDQPLAEEKQHRIRALAAHVEGLHGIAAIKYAADFNGYFGSRPRLPLLPTTADERTQIESELTGMRN
jgi:dihydrodipicolinate synthase/N-acetylneuraminate lyase